MCIWVYGVGVCREDLEYVTNILRASERALPLFLATLEASSFARCGYASNCEAG